MPKSKFQHNLQAIDNSAHDFHMFLTQFKSKQQTTHSHQNYPPSNPPNHHFLQNTHSPNKNHLPSFSPQDFYQNKSDIKQTASQIEHSQQISESSNRFEIRKPYKLNSTPPAKFSQQDNIKNQHPGQLIILRSANELPHWLFDHIRKKNADKLKKICLQQDKQRQGQVVELSDKEFEESGLRKGRDKMAQRYLNQSYVGRKEKGQVNPEAYQYQSRDMKNHQSEQNNERDYYRKMSSSSEMSNYQKSSRIQGHKISQKRQPAYINDYEYSYCPEAEGEQRKRQFKSANHKSAVFEQVYSKKALSGKKPRATQYRIRQQQKPQKVQPVGKSPTKRLATVSQEQPLQEPKKFVLC